jgi:predicted transcriptional regulator
MSKRVKVHVGTAKDMGQRFVSAWHRLERGEKVRERHVTFPNLPSMLNAVTPKRLELLQDVHREPASSVKALAERLGRDYKRVYEDVETLAAAGLLQREDGRVSAPYDAITAEMRLWVPARRRQSRWRAAAPGPLPEVQPIELASRKLSFSRAYAPPFHLHLVRRNSRARSHRSI